MKRFLIILMALALGLSVSAQRGRYNKGRKPVRTTQRVAPRPVTTIKTCPDNNHPHAIDLGLPSGRKWACCNVGASKPTAYGNYYAWGETSPKANYDDDTYKWYKSKYAWEERSLKTFYDSDTKSKTDNKTTLDPEDDAAHANWGGKWRMPEDNECAELIEHTTNKWVRNFNGTGVNGYLFTGKNGNSIFLPAAGSRGRSSLDGAGSYGKYYSRALFGGNPSWAKTLEFDPGTVRVNYKHRFYGFQVRPVTTKTCPDDNHPHTIDLGLPSGTKWACCNVGASRPTAYGDYYAWGEIATKTNYDCSTYKWGKADNQLTKYCKKSSFGLNGFTDNKTTLDLADDAARANWGGKWRMPTSADFWELLNNTSKQWISNYNGTGVNGYLFTANNGKSIFLPAAGHRDGTSLISAGSWGHYWSSSLDSDNPYRAYSLNFLYSGFVIVGVNGRCNNGHTVRPVRP